MVKTINRIAAGGANVNVTLGTNPLAEKQFPCPVCGNALPICFTKKNKPYTTCLGCGIQIFFRGKTGIRRLTEVVNSRVLLSANGSESQIGIILYNRIQQLRDLLKNLTDKQGLILRDPDLDSAIQIVENEISKLQFELSELAKRNFPVGDR
jgi:hypothetical protein